MPLPRRCARSDAFALEVSRRDLIGAASVAPLVRSDSNSSKDPTIEVCEKWLASNVEADRLQVQWGRLEDQLVRHHRWYKLTERQRCRLPAAQELFDIDERMEALHAERETLFKRVPSLRATSRSGLAAKLAVAAVAICPEDNEDAHNLIASILRDLKMMPAGTI